MRTYITTPIYYVNDKPHIGHAYTSLAADVLARWARLQGHEVFFLTGTDEHGQKVEKAARDAAMEPQAFTDQVSEHFRTLAVRMNFSNDDFIRTTEERHRRACQALWEELARRDEIYLGHYEGWYAVRDEAFYGPDELTDRKSTRLNSSHANISYAVFCLKKKNNLTSTFGETPRTRVPTSLVQPYTTHLFLRTVSILTAHTSRLTSHDVRP